MCGRYWLKSEKKVIVNEFNIYEVMADVKSDYNITPGRNVLCVTKNGHNKLVSMRWGLIPSWAKDEQIGYRTINARAETLVEKPSFLRPFQTQRCLVIADGFYEWSNVANLVSPKASAVAQGSADGARKEAKKKTPLAVRLKNNKPFGFAGLYDMWHSPEDDIITSCTIITTEPNELIATIHNRMPAILSPDIYDIWLDKNLDDTRRLMSLLIPYDSNKMEAYEVSALVNSVENNSPKLIEPVGKSTLF